MTPPRLSIIVPALNEEADLPDTLIRVRRVLPEAETIVADGGSRDRTKDFARTHGAAVISAPRGRGRQCRAGAEAARGAWLLFLHADTLLPPEASAVIDAFTARSDARIATFRLRFDQGSWFLRACAWLSRVDSVFTRFGDQGILVRRDFYERLGGFPDWPLMEDVELLRRARRSLGWIPSLPAAVETSARRFRRNREIRQQLRNATLLLRFLLGTPPEALARSYNRENEQRNAQPEGESARPAEAPALPRPVAQFRRNAQ